MSEKYKVYDSKIPTFITLTTVGWVDVFTRNNYAAILDKSLAYCIKDKGLTVMAYVYMTNHIHLIVKSEENRLQDIVRDFKKFTSKEIIKEIASTNESRKEWMLNKFSYEANRTKRGEKYKFWKDGFHPIVLDSTTLLEQKLDYIHQNPVIAGFVEEAEYWKNSSAMAYALNKKNRCNFELEFIR
jgi:REP element-mobilizing transposase RayT